MMSFVFVFSLIVFLICLFICFPKLKYVVFHAVVQLQFLPCVCVSFVQFLLVFSFKLKLPISSGVSNVF